MSDRCKARRINDQFTCAQCGLMWDVDDDAPICSPSPRQNIPQPPKSLKKKQGRIPQQEWETLKEALKTDDWSGFNR